MNDYRYGGSYAGGTPQSSILIGISIINDLFWGTPTYGNPHVCVCVEHLYRCKTSYRSCQSRGAQKAHRAVPNEALYGVLRISRLITWTYLRTILCTGNGTRPSQEPLYRHILFHARLSQSVYLVLQLQSISEC